LRFHGRTLAPRRLRGVAARAPQVTAAIGLGTRSTCTALKLRGMNKMIAAFLGLALLPAAHAADPDLVIAGRGTSLEQAVAAPHAHDYRLLVRHNQLGRIRASHADGEVRGLLERARHNGAVVFVCEK